MPDTPGLLARWYADPIEEAAARALLTRGDGCTHSLARMAAHAALGEPFEGDHHCAAAPCGRSAHGRALRELLYGQLLVARRLRTGLDHLESGFQLTASLLASHDYFTVSERHALLRWLPLGNQPKPPQPLQALLTEAAVVRRLRQSIEPRLLSPDQRDIIG